MRMGTGDNRLENDLWLMIHRSLSMIVPALKKYSELKHNSHAGRIYRMMDAASQALKKELML
jgi:hypothetical protein